MKQLTKLKLKSASELSSEQMQQIAGGGVVTKEEYCQGLEEAWKYNADSWSAGTIEGWWYGWSTYCK